MKEHASFNRCYRLLWSGTTEQWKPVPETARTAKKGGRGKAANTLTLAGVLPGVAMSLFVMSNLAAQPPPQPPAPATTQLPTGGTVVGGQATISQSAIATAANMVVNQNTQRAIIDWSSFNLGSAATVQFVQPNAQSVILNRVLDPNPSQIFGRINANGQVFLTNPYGVYFSPTATVDVGGLVATTYDIRNADFMSGYYKFERVGGSGRIVNEGALRATAGGYIALLAPEVQNSGVVLARAGTVAMAAGDEVTLTIADGKSLSGITTTASSIASLIENKLAVLAPDGQIILSAVAVNKLQAGVIKNSGSLQATSMTAKGGKIVLEGDEIELTGTATVDVSGRTGGGTVLMGGDWQGGGTMRQATKVTMAANSTINASATDNGDGGKVVLWSNVSDANSQTVVHGSIKADAGPNGGKGGQIETSGHYINVDDIQVSTQAPRGAIGEWLLDPANVNIVNGANVNSTESAGVFTPNATATTVNISNVTLANALANTSVTVTTSGSSAASAGDINIAANISWGSSSVLTLNANNSVIGAGNISMTGGGGVVFNTTNTTSTAAYSGVISGNGSVTKLGVGVLNLSGSNTYTGNTTVGAGTLASGVNGNTTSGAFGQNANLILADAAGVTLKINNTSYLGSLTGGTRSAVDVGIYTLHAGTNNGSGTFSGRLLGSGGLQKVGTGTLNITGNSSTYTGTLNVSAGRLVLTNATSVGNGTNQIRITGNTGTLELQNISSFINPINLTANGTLLLNSGNTTLSGNVTSANSVQPRINIAAGNTLTIAGNITMGSSAVLAKDGAGNLLLSETASTTNQSLQGINVTEGVLEMNSSILRFSGSSNNTIGTGAVMKLDYFNSATTSNTIVNFTNNGVMQFTPTASPNNYFAGNISGTGSVDIMGSVLTRLGRGGSYTGGTTIRQNSSGTIDHSSNSFGDSSSALVNDGTLYLKTGGSADWNQSISGSGNLFINSADTFVRDFGVRTAHTYTGTTTIGPYANVKLGGLTSPTTTATLSTGDIILDGANATLTITRANNITLANNISGTGGISAMNSDQVTTLTGNVNITGNLSVGLNSTLKIGTTGVLGSNGIYAGNINFINTNGTFEYAGTSDLKLTGNMTETAGFLYGVIRKSTSSSNLIVTGNNALRGAVYVEAGTLYALGSNSSTGELGIGNISNNATLVFNHTDAGNLSLSSISGNISGSGNVTFISVGNITLDKTINLSGANSTLLLQSNGNITVNSSLTSSGASGKISLRAGAAAAAGTGTGGQIAINSSVNLTLNSSGTVVMFQGNNSANLTATLEARIVGANTTGVAKYKTYNASVNSISNAVAGTRNYFYRIQPNVTLSGGTITATKVYDGTNIASPIYTPSGGNVTGSDGDLLTGRAIGATYNSSSAGTGKTLNLTLEIASANTSWVISGYNSTINTTTTTTTANITKAPLTVKANDDARFVTFSDTVGYTGASYSGFVNNETLATSGVTGTLAIARSSASNAAGTYALTPSGLSANNYNITFANGTYTIVPAQQLIVRVNDGTSVYGNTPNLTVASASYLMPDNVTIVNLTSNLSVSNAGLYSLQDGASGSASFNLGLVNATMSTANHAAVGVWNVGYSNLNKVGVNFNNMTVVGTQTITPRTLNITATATNKEYDGNTYASVVLANNLLSNDVVNTTADTSGLFADKNAGTGKTVTVSNISMSGGADAGNYILSSSVATTTANITPRELSLLSLAASDKVYDGTTNATIAFSGLGGLIGLDDVQVATTGVFSDKNVGTSKSVTVSRQAISGTDAGNYQLSSATTAASITPKELSITGLSAVTSKVYDGTTTASPLGTASLFALEAPGTGTSSDGKAFTGDVVSLSGTPTGTYNSKDVATAANVTLAGLTLTGAQAGNYVLAMPAPITANITPAPLVVRANDDANFVLVANAAGYAGASYSGFVNNENATSTGFASALSISRSDAANVSAGTYTLTPSGLTSTNYNVSYQTGTYTIVPAQTLLIRVSNDSSVYGSSANMNVTSASYLMSDNTTIVNLTNNLSLSSGLYTVQDGASGSATFNLGLTNVTLSHSGNTAVGIWNVGYSNLNKVGVNFNDMTVIGTQTVTAKAINVTATAANKEYNGNTNATMTLSSADVISGDNISYAYSNANFISKNVETNKTATATNLALSGDDATNYAIQNLVAEATANITAKTLNVSGITATNKVYDGNTTATINTSGVTNASLVSGGMVTGDNVVVSATGSFADKNVNTSILVTLSSTYSGADAGNYNINSQANTTANITAKVLTISGITAADKVYDGNTTATTNIAGVTNAVLLAGGLVAGDNVTVSATGTFADKNVNTSKVVTLNSTYGGTDVGNYNITSQTNTTANITAKTLNITGITANTKVYDGNTSATINTSGVTNATLVSGGMVAGDSVTVSATGAFADKNANLSKVVMLTSTYGGTDVSNYNITSQTFTQADITPKALNISGITAANKVYDGNTSATINTAGVTNATLVSGGMVTGDNVTVAATGTFADKNVNTSKVVTLSSTYGGADAGNYNITSQVNTTANITAKALTLSGITADNKVYDGNTNATINTSGVTNATLVSGGMVAGDNVTVSASGTFADKNANTSILVTLNSTYGGADASNYNITSQANTTGNITAKAVTLTAPQVTRAYDGTTNYTALAADLAALSAQLGIAGDSVTGITLAYLDKNVGTNKTVTATGATLSDGNNGLNYNLSYANSSVSAITPKAITLTGITADNKVYDGTTTATVNTSGVTNATWVTAGMIVGDALTVSATGTFADKNAGTSKVVTLNSTYGGADVGNYNITSQVNTTADITPKSLTVTGLSTPSSKVYDGTTTATLLTTGQLQSASSPGAGNSTDGKPYTGDTVNLAGTPTGTYNSKDVASAANLSISGLSLSGSAAGNYVLTTPTPIAATITPAPLVVRANDDARFVTLSDTVGYAGASYNGFVNSETLATSGVTGALAIARSDSANGAAGSYTLTPSGLTASNYNLSYQTGTYTIVPAQTLLIRVGSTSTLYGNAMSLNVTNASYLMSDNVTIVNLTSSLSVSNGLYTVQDGASGSASFNLGVSNVTMSGSGHVPVGIWNVGAGNLTKTSSNFVTLAAVGTQTVTAKSITVSATAANKAYDGNTNATVTLSSADVLTGDAISYGFTTASFASNSVEANKSVAITNISLAGGDAQNYRLQNLMATATADITAASNSNSGGGGGGSSSSSDELLTSQRALAVTTQTAERSAPTRVVTRSESRSSSDAVQTPSPTRASASGVLPVAVIEDNRMSNLGMTYEQQPNDIHIQLTTAPAITPPAPTLLRFSGNFKTFLVMNDQGEAVPYQGAVIGKRMVILADTASAKRLARIDMQTVLAAAITTLGADQPISLSELESVVMDLR